MVPIEHIKTSNLLFIKHNHIFSLFKHSYIFRSMATIIGLTKLRGFSPRANHTDRAAAAGRRS